MPEVVLRQALRADLDRIVDIWVDAFAHDPYLRWIQPDDDRWPAFGASWMRFIVELAFERGHTYIGAAVDVAVAWIPPDLTLADPDDIARGRDIIAAHAGERRAGDALTSIMAARAHDLEEPHWTLQYLGVRTSSQGSGIGGAAVAPILRSCDADGLPCGLVSTNPRNVAFYQRHGFTVAGSASTPDGAALLQPMHRSP